jgi:hypothetical protein
MPFLEKHCAGKPEEDTMNRTLFLLSLIVLFLNGCNPPMTQDTVYDCIVQLPDATRNYDLCVLDMSNPEHYRLLGDGWHIPDVDDMHATRFIWSSDTQSTVLLDVNEIREKEIILTLQPYRFEGAPPIVLSLEINGESIGKIHLQNEWRTYRLIVPAEKILKGINTLSIHQNRIFSPAEVMVFSRDTRTLGSCYSYIVFRDAQDPRPPGLYTIQQTLGARNFTWGGQPRHVISDRSPSSFTWPIDLPSRPVLSFGTGFLPDEYDSNGADVEFQITLTDETGKDHRLFQVDMPPPQRLLEMGWKEYSRDLKAFSGQSVMITLRTSSKPGPDKPANDGSWLDPAIMNMHVDYNLIFLPLAGSFHPTEVPAGSGLEKFVSKALKTGNMRVPDHSEPSIAGIPIDFVSLLTSEGFRAAYFYTGRNPFVIDRMTGEVFDHVSGYESNTFETYETILTDCKEWIKAMNQRRFFLCFDPTGRTEDSGFSRHDLMLIMDWLMEFRFEMDSLIVLYNPDEKNPVWLIDPSDNLEKISEIENWNALLAYIKTHFLIIEQ